MHASNPPPSKATQRAPSVDPRQRIVWALVLLALGLRCVGLTFQPLWWDEGWSLYFARTDLRSLLELTAVDIHPPLYYLMLHLWLGVWGSGVVAVRLLSVLIGVLTVPVVYATGRRLMGERGGLLAAFFLAIAPFHIYYSQEVRMYGLITLLGLAALYFALCWQPDQADGQGPIWGGYVLAAAAALHTQYYAAFLLLGLNLMMLVRWWGAGRSLRNLARWLAAQVAVLALFLPWLWYAGGKLLTYVQFKVGVEGDAPMGLATYIGRHLAALSWGHAEGPLTDVWWLGLLPLLLLLAALVGLGVRCRLRPSLPGAPFHLGRVAVLLLIVFLCTLLCGFVLNQLLPFTPLRGERLLLLTLPTYLLLFVAGLQALGRRRRWLAGLAGATLVLAAIVSLVAFYTTPRYPDDDYRPVAERVGALAQPADAILCVHPWQVGYFQAYLPDARRPALVLTPREVVPQERQIWADNPAIMASDLDRLLREHDRIWFPAHQAMGRVLEIPIETHLTEQAYPALREWSGAHTVLSLYVAGQTQPQDVTAEFGSWLTLENAALGAGERQAGWGVVPIDLWWRLDETPPDPYQVGLRLTDSAGRVWAQRDSAPGGGSSSFAEWPPHQILPDQYGLLIPAGTPPGEYQVTLRVYRADDVQVLPVTFPGGSGGEMVLGTVQVVRPSTWPPVEALEFDYERPADWGGRLRLLGFSGSGSSVVPGDAIEVELFWQVLTDPGEDWLPSLQLLDAEGVVQVSLTEKPVAGAYPTAWWKAGELVRDPHALYIPATVAPGRYDLALSLVRAADGALVDEKRGQTSLTLMPVEVASRAHRMEPTSPEKAQRARFASSVELVGYDLPVQEYAPGSSLEITLHWHALDTPDRNYRVFVHLIDGAGTIVTQDDKTPGSTLEPLPTLGWLPGEFVTDPHNFQLPFGMAAGPYRLKVGFYDPPTGQRLGEPILLDTAVTVETP